MCDYSALLALFSVLFFVQRSQDSVWLHHNGRQMESRTRLNLVLSNTKRKVTIRQSTDFQNTKHTQRARLKESEWVRDRERKLRPELFTTKTFATDDARTMITWCAIIVIREQNEESDDAPSANFELFVPRLEILQLSGWSDFAMTHMHSLNLSCHLETCGHSESRCPARDIVIF